MQLDVLHRRVMMDARLIQDAIDPLLPAVRPSAYHDHAVNAANLVRRLNAVTEPLNVHNHLFTNLKVPKHTVYFTGLWLPETDLPLNESSADVRVEWHVHPAGRRLIFTDTDWKRLRFLFWTYLMHEILHRHQNIRQHESRVYRPLSEVESIREEQRYLGEFDEIEAYSHDVALEMLIYSQNAPFTTALRRIRAISTDTITSYNTYTSAFAGTPNHAALPVFDRKLKEWYRLLRADYAFYSTFALEAIW